MEFSKEKIDELVLLATNEKLCASVIVHRALGMFEEIAIASMRELLNRKNAGSDFDFDKYINDEIKEFQKIKLPDSKINITSIFKMANENDKSK